MSQPSQRHRFAMLDALAALLVLMVLFALSLPAIQAAREHARAIQCSNNLKNISLGLHCYHDTFKTFPAGAIHAGRKGQSERMGPSWWYGLLPFVEQRGAYDAISMTQRAGFRTTGVPFNAQAISGVYDDLLATFKPTFMRCPSSPLPVMERPNGPIALPSYVGISGGCDISEDSSDYGAEGSFPQLRGPSSTRTYINRFKGVAPHNGIMTRNGMLPPCVQVGIPACNDGTSNTIIVAEQSDWLRDADSNNPVKYHGDAGWDTNGTAGTGPDDGGGFLSGMAASSPIPRIQPPDTTPAPWDIDCYNVTTVRYRLNAKRVLGAHSHPGCSEDHGPNNPLQSAHPGGALVGFVDGAVVLLSEDVDLVILLRLAIRDDGQNVRASPGLPRFPLEDEDYAVADDAEGKPQVGPSAKEAKRHPGRSTEAPVSTLVRELQRGNASVRRDAALTLGRIGAEANAAAPALVKALKDEDAEVRREAAGALGSIGSCGRRTVNLELERQGEVQRNEEAVLRSPLGAKVKAVVAALVESLKDEDGDVRRYAALALCRIGLEAKSAVPAVIEVLKDKDSDEGRDVKDAAEPALLNDVWFEGTMYVTHKACTKRVVIERYTFHQSTGEDGNDESYYSWDYHRHVDKVVLGTELPSIVRGSDYTLGGGALGRRDRVSRREAYFWIGGHLFSETHGEWQPFRWLRLSHGRARFAIDTVQTVQSNFYGNPTNNAGVLDDPPKPLPEKVQSPRPPEALAAANTKDQWFWSAFSVVLTRSESDIKHALSGIDVSAVPALIKALEDEDARDRAAVALSRIGTEAAVLALVEAFKDSPKDGDGLVWRVAVAALGEIGSLPKSLEPVLVGLLEDGNKYARIGAASALGRSANAEAAVSTLIELLEDEDRHVRQGAMVALGSIDAQAVVPALVRALKDKDNETRRFAVQSLGSIAREWRARRPELAGWQQDETKRAIVRALIETEKMRIAVPALIRSLKDKHVRVRESAARELKDAEACTKADVPALVEALTSEDRTVRNCAATALSDIDVEAVPALIEALRDEAEDVRVAAAVTLERIGPDAQHAIPALEDVSRSDASRHVRQVASKVLAAIKKRSQNPTP